MTRRAEIIAVHDDEKRALLERLGAAEAYDSGALRCSVCGEALRDSGIGAVRIVDGELVASCGKPDCLEGLGT